MSSCNYTQVHGGEALRDGGGLEENKMEELSNSIANTDRAQLSLLTVAHAFGSSTLEAEVARCL